MVKMTADDFNFVERIRTRILLDNELNRHHYDQDDIERLASCDWCIKRFLIQYRNDPRIAFGELQTILKKRKALGVNQLQESDFPAFFFASGALITYGIDKNGATMIILRVRLNKRFPAWVGLIKKFFLFQYERLDRLVQSGKKITMVFDVSGADRKNADLDFVSFVVSVAWKHYPMSLSSVLICNLPESLNMFYKVVKHWLPQESSQLLKVVSTEELKNFVDEDQLPDFLYGNCKKPYNLVPKGAPTAEEVGRKLGLKQDEIDSAVSHFQQFIVKK